MDYTNFLKELNKASLFDLYRLNIAIGNELNNAQRIQEIKKNLRITMDISYFNHFENRLARAKVVELRQKKAVILDIVKQKIFVVPYCMINIDNTETSIYETSETLTINNLRVGDYVGFNNKGKDIVGIVKRLSQKTVTLVANSGEQWRVAYSHLYRVHNAEVVLEKLPTIKN